MKFYVICGDFLNVKSITNKCIKRFIIKIFKTFLKYVAKQPINLQILCSTLHMVV